MLRSPQVTFYSRDVARLMGFYEALGCRETFRTPRTGDTPDHVELDLDGFKIGIASVTAAARDHGLDPDPDGAAAELVLWADDTDAEYERLIRAGARSLSEPHDWLTNLRVAWVADPDGNPIQVVQLVQHRDR